MFARAATARSSPFFRQRWRSSRRRRLRSVAPLPSPSSPCSVWRWPGRPATIGATIAKRLGTVGLIQQRVDSRSRVYNEELGCKPVYLATLQRLVEQQRERAVQKSHASEIAAAAAGLAEPRRQTVAEF